MRARGGQGILHPEDPGSGRGQVVQAGTERCGIWCFRGEDQQSPAAVLLPAGLEGGGAHPERNAGGQEPGRGPGGVIGIARNDKCVAGSRIPELARGRGRIPQRIRERGRRRVFPRWQSSRLGDRPRGEAVAERDRPGGDVIEGVGAGPDVRVPESGISAALAMLVHIVEEFLAEPRVLLEQDLQQPTLRLGARHHQAPGRNPDFGGRPAPRKHRQGGADGRLPGGPPHFNAAPKQHAEYRIEPRGVG